MIGERKEIKEAWNKVNETLPAELFKKIKRLSPEEDKLLETLDVNLTKKGKKYSEQERDADYFLQKGYAMKILLMKCGFHALEKKKGGTLREGFEDQLREESELSKALEAIRNESAMVSGDAGSGYDETKYMATLNKLLPDEIIEEETHRDALIDYMMEWSKALEEEEGRRRS